MSHARHERPQAVLFASLFATGTFVIGMDKAYDSGYASETIGICTGR